MEQAEIISQIITVSPVVAVLVWFIIYFKREIKELKEENSKLTDELRESEKEAIKVIQELNSTLRELIAEIRR